VTRWWQLTREVVTFALGVAVILDTLISEHWRTGELLAGLVMIGILPLDRLLGAIGRRPSRPPENS
jgi:hypothetical protein